MTTPKQLIDSTGVVVSLINHIDQLYSELCGETGTSTYEGDVYRYIAARAFDIEEDAVTQELRNFVKTVLFGRRFAASPATIINAIADKQPTRPAEVEYAIWSEGFRATGESGTARYHGKAKGSSFAEACAWYATKNPIWARYFDEINLTYWGCKLFDNEADARKRFG